MYCSDNTDIDLSLVAKSLVLITVRRVHYSKMGKVPTTLMRNWIVWNRTVYMYKMDLALNNLQWLMCHKTKPNKISCSQPFSILHAPILSCQNAIPPHPPPTSKIVWLKRFFPNTMYNNKNVFFLYSYKKFIIIIVTL